MKRVMILLAASIAFCYLSGCASVQIYSNANLKNRAGLRFYSVKPYLLVELKSEKDMTVKTSVIYLPDLANPQYLYVKPGIGSSELKMTFSNGILNSYGLTSSSDIPETINSLASLIAKSSDAVKQLTAPGVSSQPGSEENNFILYEIVFTQDGTGLKKIKITE